MKLRNEKKKQITVIYQGQKIIVNPGQEIDGPIQLSIFGLTPIKSESNIKSTILFKEEADNPFKVKNDKEIDKALNYISNFNKSSLPDVSICILSKDSYNLINDCITSIEAFVKYPNTRIYIFDTGTTDQLTIDFYKHKTSTCKIPFEVIPVGDYHFSRNYNTGLKHIKSDYFLIQNNDTVALNDYVTKLMKVAILDKVGACGPRMLYRDGRIQHDGQIIYDHKKKGFGSPTHVNLGANPVGLQTGRHIADGVTCAGMLIKSSIFWESGGLNEKYHDIFQDVELNVKIRMNGYAIVCDRTSLINHYDNTSRNAFWENNVNKLKMKHLDYDLLFGKFDDELIYKERPRKKFSIVTLVNDQKVYSDFLNDLKLQDCNFDFEIVAIPNFNNFYTSSAEALNIGVDLSESEYIIMAHQDLRVPNNWLDSIFDHIKEFIANNITFGVLGMAGCWWFNIGNESGVIYVNGENNKYQNTQFDKRAEVQCLDELCMVVKNNSDFRFDEVACHNYHLYGTDLCLNYLSKGYRNFAINVPCTHLSDGFSNLMKIENLNKYINSSFNVFKKWRGKFKLFRNQTAKFNSVENSIMFYVSEELNKRGIGMRSTVILQD